MTASIIVFPCRARIGKIDRTVAILRRKAAFRSSADFERYWWQCRAVMRKQMMQAGADADIIDREMLEFERLVLGRLGRLPVDRSPSPTPPRAA